MPIASSRTASWRLSLLALFAACVRVACSAVRRWRPTGGAAGASGRRRARTRAPADASSMG
eukprot:scaffold1342_cov120-Isochrysis_galbana.AAC.4